MDWKAQVEYDPEADAAYIRVNEGQVDRTVDLESTELGMPVLVDIDGTGRIIGFEVLDARRRLGLME